MKITARRESGPAGAIDGPSTRSPSRLIGLVQILRMGPDGSHDKVHLRV